MIGKRPPLALVVLSAALLAACVSIPRPPTAPSEASAQLVTLENEPGPFCGRCDMVKITAVSDGRVWIEHGYRTGKYRGWRLERQLEYVTPDKFARFVQALRPYRPKGELSLQDRPACQALWNDMDGVRVAWIDANGTDKLIFNFGCDTDSNRKMAGALRAAPDLLGLASLKMPWGQWVATSQSELRK